MAGEQHVNQEAKLADMDHKAIRTSIESKATRFQLFTIGSTKAASSQMQGF